MADPTRISSLGDEVLERLDKELLPLVGKLNGASDNALATIRDDIRALCNSRICFDPLGIGPGDNEFFLKNWEVDGYVIHPSTLSPLRHDQLLANALKQLADFVRNGDTPHFRRRTAPELVRALEDYLSVRGFDVAATSRKNAAENAEQNAGGPVPQMVRAAEAAYEAGYSLIGGWLNEAMERWRATVRIDAKPAPDDVTIEECRQSLSNALIGLRPFAGALPPDEKLNAWVIYQWEEGKQGVVVPLKGGNVEDWPAEIERIIGVKYGYDWRDAEWRSRIKEPVEQNAESWREWFAKARLSAAASEEQEAVPYYVTLRQMASIVSKSKKTLERLREAGKLPSPAVKGGNGKADEWIWAVVRPILEAEYKKQLPVVFPADRFAAK